MNMTHALVVMGAATLFTSSCLGPGTLNEKHCQSDATELIAVECLSCHSTSLTGNQRSDATDGFDFDTEADVQRHAATIRKRVLVDQDMPVSGPLASCNQQLLDAYLTQLESASCIPSCSGRLCGDDACGGSCGTCTGDTTCTPSGRCETVSCTPDCAGAACGDDGCSGSCGDCSGSLTCSVSRTCICQPDCTNRNCGDDGCGGTCGTCGDTCVNGVCTCLPNCDSKECGDDGCSGNCGTCAGNDSCGGDGICACVADCTGGRTCGDNGCGGSCGTCSMPRPDCDTSAGRCVPSCTGDCTGRVCGDNGCGISCGSCGAGERCDDTGQCECAPDCTGKACGDDGCGGSCGDCDGALDCSNGQCGCTGDCTNRECGDDGCGGSCGDCTDSLACGSTNMCECLPRCDGKECGDNGCGGLCGSCSSAQRCTNSLCTWQDRSFGADVFPIFENSGSNGCGSSSCHGGVAPKASLDLSSQAVAHQQLVNATANQCTTNATRVVAGDLDASYLLNKLTGIGMCFGSRMPKSPAASLTAQELDIIRAWIASGAAP